MTTRLTDLWPAAGVRVRAGDLEMRWIDDDLLVDLAELAGRGVHAPGTTPFLAWSRGSAREVAQSVVQYQWAARPRVGVRSVKLELGVLSAGVPVGVQGASGDEWQILRQVQTGSWLGCEYQGRGIGTRMRALTLHLWFEGLGAEQVTSRAMSENAASNAVSRRVGYEPDGQARTVSEGRPAVEQRYRMTRERWIQVRERNAELLGAPIEMHGLEPLREQLGTAGEI